MPLTPGSSRDVISKNISELTHQGSRPRSREQIVAIALANARRHPGRQGGGSVNLNAPPPPLDQQQFRSKPLARVADRERGENEEPVLNVEGTYGGGANKTNELRATYRKDIPFKHGGRHREDGGALPTLDPTAREPASSLTAARNAVRIYNEEPGMSPAGVANTSRNLRDELAAKGFKGFRRGGAKRAEGGPAERYDDAGGITIPGVFSLPGSANRAANRSGKAEWFGGQNWQGPSRAILRPVEPANEKYGGAVKRANGGAIDKALKAASRSAKQHLHNPNIPHFEQLSEREIESGRQPGGLVNSAVPGRTDMHDVYVAAGSYVIPADVVSGCGEGNTINGALKISELLKRDDAKPHFQAGGGTAPEIPYFERGALRQEAIETEGTHPGGYVTATAPTRTAPIGSYIMPPEIVAGLGAGNQLAGAETMNKIVKSVAPYGAVPPEPHHGRGVGIPRPPEPYKEDQPGPSPVRFEPPKFDNIARGGRPRGHNKAVPVVIAGGEYIVTPDEVLRKGKGDLKRGHAWLDDFTLHCRKQTRSTLGKLPGPVGAKKK